MIKEIMNNNQIDFIPSEQLNTLTLERNAVLVARVKRSDFYNSEMLHALYDNLCKKFPDHPVFVWYDDVEFMAINDKTYMTREVPINDSTNYY